MSPTFEIMSGQFSGLESYKVNVDEEEEIVQEFAAKTLPIFVAFKKETEGQQSG
jgi:thioredoxin-like negative regulator of GroEL